jgi:light-regulated signal transduction histidine kinase (bacteriophytochrome)
VKGVWYSICWSPKDYNNPNSFIELDGCPRFWFSEDGTTIFKSQLQSDYPNLIIKEVFKTEIFTKNEDGENMPTHYRSGVFMPYQNPAYDTWLQKSFKINGHILERIKIRQELHQKNMFLEYASKIIRHDMHSGINTYIPRGLSTLKRKLTPEVISEYKLGMGLKLLENGLRHSQAVYQGVYAFTNLVREDVILEKQTFNITESLERYLSLTAYSSNVKVAKDMPTIEANESLFCTAIDNFVRNGMAYNDSSKKIVKIYMCSDTELAIEDNGRGITQEQFERLTRPYERKSKQKEVGMGLGLNICVAILNEHDFSYTVEKLERGTKIKVRVL